MLQMQVRFERERDRERERERENVCVTNNKPSPLLPLCWVEFQKHILLYTHFHLSLMLVRISTIL